MELNRTEEETVTLLKVARDITKVKHFLKSYSKETIITLAVSQAVCSSLQEQIPLKSNLSVSRKNKQTEKGI